MQTVGDALRLMVAGDDEISNYREGSEQYPVKMRVLENQRGDIDAIGKLTVASSRGELVRIDNIAQLERGLGPSTLQRFNRQFSVNLNSDLSPGAALDRASADVRKILDDLKLPAGLFVPAERADEDSRRDDRQPDSGDRRWRASSSTWCWRRSSRASSSRS